MVKICDTTTYPESNESVYLDSFASFGFPLSPFQKYAIEAILEGHHVLVTAHTGSGKTLPAEFAIKHFVKSRKRVIYTSPIKALSNQKYYEFSRKYPDITFGLLTGDIKTNPEADVLIMTTEILMNTLFRKTVTIGDDGLCDTSSLHFQMDIDTELACVIFDEVHYINDSERGQVWEKTILMLPHHIQMVMLSATIDAPVRFAEWCERGGAGGKTVYLASTSHRVVPLTHYGFLTTTETIFKGMKDKVLEKDLRDNTNKLILLQTADGKYNEPGYKDLKRILGVFEDREVFLKRKAVLNNLALFLRDHEMLPAIAFVFSRKNVERCAQEITVPLLEFDSKVAYTVARECEQIIRKLPNYREYLELPEYQQLVKLLENGIGIHHSGMIPILREIVELMISKKYIKLLFATESFAIGLDCPIKTAVFTGLKKFDGNEERYLLSHEYTQMAGRAGRRGIDTIGHVVHCNNLFPLPDQSTYKGMLGGSPQKLVSKFRISYPIILGYLGKSENPVSISTFVEFVEKSMIFEEVKKEIAQQMQIVVQTTEKVDAKQKQLTILQTPLDICRSYLDAETKLQSAVNKKRKELERQLQTYRNNNKYIVENAKMVREYDALVELCKEEQNRLDNIKTYIYDQVKKVVSVLEKQGFIQGFVLSSGTEESFILTKELGELATNIAEIHPLVFSQLLHQTNNLETISPKQLVGLLSCFTDIKVPQEYKVVSPNSQDATLQKIVEKCIQLFENIEDTECQNGMDTGIRYNNILNYDIIDDIMDWCNCETEQECKYFIQQTIGGKDISVGDFNKAILKIATITKELMSLAEKQNMVIFRHTLSQIEPMILKYVATSQSLYV